MINAVLKVNNKIWAMIRFTTTGADFIISSLTTFPFGNALALREGNGGSYFVGGFIKKS
jgi:hypothetical protein